MKNILVINGEADWQEYFPGYGSYILLESNDIPGFSGFPRTVREAVAALLLAKIERTA